MSTNHKFKKEAIDEIYRLWQIDADGCEWTADVSGYGFDWWPGEFKVEVRIAGPFPHSSPPLYRISVRTAFLRGADTAAPNFFESLSQLNRFAPTYAICAPSASNGEVVLQSTAFVYEGATWLTRLFASLAILQPIAAQSYADAAVEYVGGEPDRSRSGPLDQMLEAEQLIYVPAGEQENRWIGKGEFEHIVEKWGRSDRGFGMGDEHGLSFETPFGDESALITLHTDSPHPTLGTGLMVLVRLPLSIPEDEAAQEANRLNCLEAASWSNAPLIGNWSVGDGGLVHCSFVPNLLYQNGIAENLILRNVARAQWLRELIFPDAIDLPMHEILKSRLAAGRSEIIQK